MKLILSLVVFLCFAHALYAQDKVFAVGEELRYEVSYGFIKLGEIEMKVNDMKNAGGKKIYNCVCRMKSYEGIPFVDLNTVFESDIVYTPKEIYSERFKATEYHDEGIRTIEYRFVYDSDFVYVKKVFKGVTELDEKVRFNSNVKFQDGLSLLYSTRTNSFSQDNFLIPVFMNESETSVNYFFSTKPEDITISMSDKDLKAVKCSGTANFTGVFGLSGEFAGWFSVDEARVPLRSQLNVTIGSITLELTSFRRAGWNPLK